jgi:hypothetical protein
VAEVGAVDGRQLSSPQIEGESDSGHKRQQVDLVPTPVGAAHHAVRTEVIGDGLVPAEVTEERAHGDGGGELGGVERTRARGDVRR